MSKEKLLIIDDEKLIRWYLPAEMLQGFEHKVKGEKEPCTVFNINIPEEGIDIEEVTLRSER